MANYRNLYKQNNNNFFNLISKFLVALVVGILLLVVYFFFDHNYYPVEGESMLPTISSTGNSVFVSMFDDYTYGDIVVAYNPDNVRILKRVIGLGGDKIAFIFNEEQECYELALIYKNTNEVVIVDEPYIKDKSVNSFCAYELYTSNPSKKTFETQIYNNQETSFLVVPDDYVFLLGDNRKVSLDCSVHGAIKAKTVLGRVDLVSKTGFGLFNICLYIFNLRGTV